VFIFTLLAMGSFVFNYQQISVNRQGGLGGPLPNQDFNSQSASLIGNLIYPQIFLIEDYKSEISFDNSSLIDNTGPLGNVIFEKNGIKRYKVQSQETLYDITEKFGISLNTILWANPTIKKSIKTGQELIILPVSGILYRVKEGDMIEKIVENHNLDMALFKKYNPDYQNLISQTNQILILPNVKPQAGSELAEFSNRLPDLKNYFIMPTVGWNWGQLHDQNAVDIANRCGTPIYAAAEGLITEDVHNDLWNEGYGNYLVIEHPNGTKTLYSHTAKNLKTIGDYVKQKEEIAFMGNSGNTHGPSGCHLHFEVHGAKNPFAIK